MLNKIDTFIECVKLSNQINEDVSIRKEVSCNLSFNCMGISIENYDVIEDLYDDYYIEDLEDGLTKLKDIIKKSNKESK